MLIESLSTTMHKALQQGNSQQQEWLSTIYKLTPTEPVESVTGALPVLDGIWPAPAVGKGGEYTCNRLFVMPYIEGNAGNTFGMRLVGWRLEGSLDPNKGVWVPVPLVELTCTSASIPGPQGTNGKQNWSILPTESLCDTITLTNGSVGYLGEIVAFGAGSNLAAFAMIDLRGCQKWQFDFNAQGTQNVSMNALWARA